MYRVNQERKQHSFRVEWKLKGENRGGGGHASPYRERPRKVSTGTERKIFIHLDIERFSFLTRQGKKIPSSAKFVGDEKRGAVISINNGARFNLFICLHGVEFRVSLPYTLAFTRFYSYYLYVNYRVALTHQMLSFPTPFSGPGFRGQITCATWTNHVLLQFSSKILGLASRSSAKHVSFPVLNPRRHPSKDV